MDGALGDVSWLGSVFLLNGKTSETMRLSLTHWRLNQLFLIAEGHGLPLEVL
jgi:hypothetical protein